jgi:D-arabinose 1-dehydrogenase-like Zn-dependent alcohol dehydrogenase
MCAGVTTFNALPNSGARPGEVVAVLGLGGLGHLGVQYAAKMGFHTVGIARGKDKEPLARQLGASVYIDSQAQDPAAELLKLGGAQVILATATSGEAMSAVQGGVAVNGTLLIVGAAESMQVSPIALLMGCRAVEGWYSGTSIDSQDTLAFSVRTGVRPMNETYPLERVSEGHDHMMSGQARFRVVLTIGHWLSRAWPNQALQQTARSSALGHAWLWGRAAALGREAYKRDGFMTKIHGVTALGEPSRVGGIPH